VPKLNQIIAVEKGVKSKALVTFTRQFSTLQDAGLPVLRSLKILEGQMKPDADKVDRYYVQVPEISSQAGAALAAPRWVLADVRGGDFGHFGPLFRRMGWPRVKRVECLDTRALREAGRGLTE